MSSHKPHPHDLGLPEPIVKTRRRSRRLARVMLIVAVVTAVAGWSVFGTSFFWAVKLQPQSPFLAIFAYGLLIVSSATLVLGLWYLLLAQVQRIARMVESADGDDDDGAVPRCGNCGWAHDAPDRFCRHCGKPLGVSISAASAGPSGSPGTHGVSEVTGRISGSII